MKRKITKYRRDSKKRKLEKRANLLFSSIGALLFLLTVFASFQLYMKNDFKQTRIYKEYKNIEVPYSRVCMSTDKIKVKPTIPIEVNGQEYYACCNKCLRRLEVNYNKQRYAIDPYSGKSVQKNNSYIRLQKNASGKVQYFESEANFHSFRDQSK